MKPEQIISDESVEEVHANANFGSMTKRKVVNLGVVQSFLGYSIGHTMNQIILEHGLVRRSSGMHPMLTAKGKRYLYALIGSRASEIIHLIAEGDQSTCPQQEVTITYTKALGDGRYEYGRIEKETDRRKVAAGITDTFEEADQRRAALEAQST